MPASLAASMPLMRRPLGISISRLSMITVGIGSSKSVTPCVTRIREAA